tara:strand:+ start:195 stop:569 length:375 start_codon:yes stop_codon:yes gene_type:complete
MTDNKDLIRNFIQEEKQRKYLKDLFKQNTIEFDKYFKRSKKSIDEVDPTIGIGDRHKTLIAIAERSKKIKENKESTLLEKEEMDIIEYFYNNPNLTMRQMAKNLNMNLAKVSKTMNKNLDRTQW